MKKPVSRMLGIGYVCALLFLVQAAAYAQPPEDAPDPASLVQQQLHALPTDEVEQFWQSLMEEYGGFLPELNQKSFLDLLQSLEDGWGIKPLLSGLFSYLFQEMLLQVDLLGTIIVLTVLALILSSVQSSFEQANVSKLAYATVYLVMIVLIINSFRIAIQLVQDTVSNMVNFMLAMIPLLMSLLISLGNVASVGLLHPLLLFMVNVIGNLVNTLVLPLVFLSGILHIISSFTTRYRVSKLASFINQLSLGLMGVMATVFLSVISIQGLSASVADGVTLRTAKFIAGNFVPVVGRLFAGAADTVVGASLLVKNAIGMTGVFILLAISLFPALKVLAMGMIYSFAAAVMQPMGDSPVTQCLSVVGRSLFVMLAAMSIVSLMFFLAITIVIAAGNITLMMR